MAEQKTILVVDDDFSVARLVASALEDEGFAAAIVTDGRELMERAIEVHPELILLDVVMPFSGLEDHLQRLHEDTRTRRIPVMLVTADSRTGSDLDRWRDFGVVDSILKPFDLGVLSEKVNRVLGAP